MMDTENGYNSCLPTSSLKAASASGLSAFQGGGRGSDFVQMSKSDSFNLEIVLLGQDSSSGLSVQGDMILSLIPLYLMTASA